MNKENGRLLLDWLKSMPDSEWSMCIYLHHECGCFVGHTARLRNRPVSVTETISWLELEWTESESLLHPNYKIASHHASIGTAGYISRKRACGVLEHLIETGKLDWSSHE